MTYYCISIADVNDALHHCRIYSIQYWQVLVLHARVCCVVLCHTLFPFPLP
jgi:hypothetical protein